MNLFKIERQDNGFRVFFGKTKIFSYHKNHKTEFDKRFDNRFKELTDDELKFLVCEQYKKIHGYYPNLENPQTFNEKLTWEKLYYRNPLMTICADKVKGRDYYCDKIANGRKHLVKQLGVYSCADDIDKIDFEALPKKFVFKLNVGSGRQIIVEDKATFDIEDKKKELKEWLKPCYNHYYAAFEWSYKNIPSQIVCEEFLDFEYKLEFFCFNGEVKFFWIVLNDKTDKVQANFYELNWHKMPLTNHYPNFDKTIQKPDCFEEILNNAKILCGDFPFIRCDFYITKNSYYFSEMTFFHWGCCEKFDPIEYDTIFGAMMTLPK